MRFQSQRDEIPVVKGWDSRRKGSWPIRSHIYRHSYTFPLIVSLDVGSSAHPVLNHSGLQPAINLAMADGCIVREHCTNAWLTRNRAFDRDAGFSHQQHHTILVVDRMATDKRDGYALRRCNEQRLAILMQSSSCVQQHCSGHCPQICRLSRRSRLQTPDSRLQTPDPRLQIPCLRRAEWSGRRSSTRWRYWSVPSQVLSN